MLWGAGVRPSPLAAALGVPLDRAGRVIVGPDCAVPGHPELFVIGDMASFTPDGAQRRCPASARSAIQQARLVARNILDEVAGPAAPAPFRYFDKGFMATIGRARAVAQLGRLRMSGLHRLAGVGVRPPLVPGRLPQPRWPCSRTGSGPTSSRATARA